MKVLHISRSMSQGGAYVDELKKQRIPHYLIPNIDGKNPFAIINTIRILERVV